MKNVIINSVNDGLSSDTSPESTQASVLTDAENVDILTTSDNSFILQKREGTTYLIKDNIEVKLPDMYTPLAVNKLNGILYIISANAAGNTEIGTYPSPDWDKINLSDTNTQIGTMDIVYANSTVPGESNFYSFSANPSSITSSTFKAREITKINITIKNTGTKTDIYNFTITSTSSQYMFLLSDNTLSSTINNITLNSGTSHTLTLLADTAVSTDSTLYNAELAINTTTGGLNSYINISSMFVDASSTVNTATFTPASTGSADSPTGEIPVDIVLKIPPSDFNSIEGVLLTAYADSYHVPLRFFPAFTVPSYVGSLKLYPYTDGYTASETIAEINMNYNYTLIHAVIDFDPNNYTDGTLIPIEVLYKSTTSGTTTSINITGGAAPLIRTSGTSPNATWSWS